MDPAVASPDFSSDYSHLVLMLPPRDWMSIEWFTVVHLLTPSMSFETLCLVKPTAQHRPYHLQHLRMCLAGLSGAQWALVVRCSFLVPVWLNCRTNLGLPFFDAIHCLATILLLKVSFAFSCQLASAANCGPHVWAPTHGLGNQNQQPLLQPQHLRAACISSRPSQAESKAESEAEIEAERLKERLWVRVG